MFEFKIQFWKIYCKYYYAELRTLANEFILKMLIIIKDKVYIPMCRDSRCKCGDCGATSPNEWRPRETEWTSFDFIANLSAK